MLVSFAAYSELRAATAARLQNEARPPEAPAWGNSWSPAKAEGDGERRPRLEGPGREGLPAAACGSFGVSSSELERFGGRRGLSQLFVEHLSPPMLHEDSARYGSQGPLWGTARDAMPRSPAEGEKDPLLGWSGAGGGTQNGDSEGVRRWSPKRRPSGLACVPGDARQLMSLAARLYEEDVAAVVGAGGMAAAEAPGSPEGLSSPAGDTHREAAVGLDLRGDAQVPGGRSTLANSTESTSAGRQPSKCELVASELSSLRGEASGGHLAPGSRREGQTRGVGSADDQGADSRATSSLSPTSPADCGDSAAALSFPRGYGEGGPSSSVADATISPAFLRTSCETLRTGSEGLCERGERADCPRSGESPDSAKGPQKSDNGAAESQRAASGDASPLRTLQTNAAERGGSEEEDECPFWCVRTRGCCTTRPAFHQRAAEPPHVSKCPPTSLFEEAEAFVAKTANEALPEGKGAGGLRLHQAPRHLALYVAQISSRMFFDPQYRSTLLTRYTPC
ncbi:hypothetical protein BESB_018520 [Besnoitia besnoiti]|uniref:Uncharacterized protein n=1 Tax=Besnoitia besnoiti TaxID=94643 RepID=A0A2A9M5Q6_BESBE|nr:hypothetical protein BESB_018520 [Besnoitia besnoiti]PFH32534.1 hypothetical protein BESB_018520 [Besnoitia besnoiti]